MFKMIAVNSKIFKKASTYALVSFQGFYEKVSIFRESMKMFPSPRDSVKKFPPPMIPPVVVIAVPSLGSLVNTTGEFVVGFLSLT